MLRMSIICLFALWLNISVYVVWAADDDVDAEQFVIAGHVIFTKQALNALDHLGYQRSLNVRSNIFVADTIETGSNNLAQLRLRDGSIFELSALTQLSIGDFFSYNSESVARTELHLHQGKIQFYVGLFGVNKDALRLLRTPFGNIETYNGMFTAEFKDKLIVKVHSGELKLSNSSGQLLIGEEHAFQKAQVAGKLVAPIGMMNELVRK